MLPRSPYSSLKNLRKKADLPPVKLPQHKQKSLSPSHNIRSPKQECLLHCSDNYYDEFYKIFNRNNVIRENWISAHQRLIRVETESKIRKMSLPAVKQN